MASQKSTSLRALSCELGLLNKADGSASFSQGNTSVMVGAYGPTEVRINKEIVDRATVEVVFRPKTGIPGCAEKAMERLIRNTCDAIILTSMHPRSAMMIVVQELHNDGSLLSCAINGACMTMLNTGFPMKYAVSSVTCALLSDGSMETDPNLKQEKEATAVFTFAFEAIYTTVLTSTSRGIFTVEQYEACQLVCQECARKIFEFYRLSIRRKLSKALPIYCDFHNYVNPCPTDKLPFGFRQSNTSKALDAFAKRL